MKRENERGALLLQRALYLCAARTVRGRRTREEADTVAKIHIPGNGQAYFMCPGCTARSGFPEFHSVSIDPAQVRQMSDGSKPCWQFNGNLEQPTLTPSVNYPDWCHFFVRDGKIEYLPDSKHALSGQTVDLPDWKEED